MVSGLSGFVDGTIEPGQRLQAGGGDAAEDLAAVLGAALAGHEFLGLQAVEEPGDAGVGLDHPLGDGEGGDL